MNFGFILKFNFNKNKLVNKILEENLEEGFIFGSEGIFFYNKKIFFKFLEEKNYLTGELKNLKYNLSLSNNGSIETIIIFNDLIQNKDRIILSRILNKLGTSKTIFARKCDIQEIESKNAREFLERTHIQGYCKSSIKIGLYYQGKLVSIMTFGEKRVALGNKKNLVNEYELLRFSSENDTVVIGGASRLINYFIKNYKPKNILSFADRNWSNGNVYEKLGFTKISETNPNYWYIKDGERFHRFNFRKDKLVSDGYDSSKTEKVIMEERGFLKIYDCGNFKYEMNL